MNNNELLIAALLKAREENQPIPLQNAINLTPINENEAYQVQKVVSQKLGWFQQKAPKVWKLGGTKGNVTAAALAQSSLVIHSEKRPFILKSDEACSFTGLELELTVKLKKTLTSSDTFDDVISAIGEVYLSLEVCDQRAEEWQKLPSLFRLADHHMNRSIILFGDPLSNWSDDLTHISPMIKLGNKVLNEKLLSHPQGHPLEALLWLAELSQKMYQEPLVKGTIIATGAWAGIQEISKLKPFYASLKGFDDIEVLLS